MIFSICKEGDEVSVGAFLEPGFAVTASHTWKPSELSDAQTKPVDCLFWIPDDKAAEGERSIPFTASIVVVPPAETGLDFAILKVDNLPNDIKPGYFPVGDVTMADRTKPATGVTYHLAERIDNRIGNKKKKQRTTDVELEQVLHTVALEPVTITEVQRSIFFYNGMFFQGDSGSPIVLLGSPSSNSEDVTAEESKGRVLADVEPLVAGGHLIGVHIEERTAARQKAIRYVALKATIVREYLEKYKATLAAASSLSS